MTPFAFYQLVLGQCPDQPNLSLIQQPSPCPEAWPLFFKGLVVERRRVLGFNVCDGHKTTVFCTTNVPEVLDKLATLDEGAILHLINGQPKYLAQQKIGILITDHNVRETLGICVRAYIVNQGKIRASGLPKALANDQNV
jgi:hypothetical protein